MPDKMKDMRYKYYAVYLNAGNFQLLIELKTSKHNF